MAELTLIQKLPHVHGLKGHHLVKLPVERATMAKRRWRGVARDGREFGFDLDETLSDGTPFFVEGDTYYVLEQLPEEVLEIPVSSVQEAARVAWNLGNLHFGVEVRPDGVRVTGDSAILQFLARENITFKKMSCIFRPLVAGGHHHHEHSHSHHHHG
jgi:urease accessory protein